MRFFGQIKQYLLLAGGAIALLASYLRGKKHEQQKHQRAKVKEQARIIQANLKRNEEWRKIDEQVSKNSAHLNSYNVADELNQLFSPTNNDDQSS